MPIAYRIPVNSREIESMFEQAENGDTVPELTANDIDRWAAQAQQEIDRLFSKIEVVNLDLAV